MDNKEQIVRLREEGKSLRQIAAEVGVSKSTVANYLKTPVTKGWLNPTWQVVGGPTGTADVYGAIPEPTAQELLELYSDSAYEAAKWISDTLSSIPLLSYVKTAPGQKQPKCATRKVSKNAQLDHFGNFELKEVLDHPFKTLIDEPNDRMNRNEFLRIVDLYLSLAGNAFAYKIRENHETKEDRDVNEGLPVALWPLLCQHVKLALDDKGYWHGFWYAKTHAPKFIPKQDMIWFKFVDPRDPYGLGMSPLRGVYERVLNSKSEIAYLSALYRNQARPDSIVSIRDITMAEAEVTQKTLNARFKQGGIGGVMVVPGGEMEMTTLGWSPKDVFGTDLYKWNKQQVLNAYGLNEAIFMTESSNRAVAESAIYMATRNAILPRCRLIEEKLNQDLAPEFDSRLLVAFENPVQEDNERVLQEQRILLRTDVYTINEVRALRGMPPVEWGDGPLSELQGKNKAQGDKDRGEVETD